MTNQIEIRIAKREPFACGHAFEGSGVYEKLAGRAHFAVDPLAAAQAGIVDLGKAPINDSGLVEFAADLIILKPADMAQGNGRLFFDYGNRGNIRALQFFNDAPGSNDPSTLDHAGNGFLMRRGYSIVWGAWQGDLLPGDGRMLLDVPIARNCDGSPITGPVRSEFIVEAPGQTCMPLSSRASTRSHPVVSLDTKAAKLTRRRYPDDPRELISADQWAFARVEGGVGLDNQGAELAIVPSNMHVYLPTGFEPGWIYEIVYAARDPQVLGLGHVAVRDLVSFLKYDSKDAAGNVNPLANAIEKAYCWGRSQTGRCIRDSIYRGFNADVEGRKVFDGALSHVAGGGLMWMNHRFANVISQAGQQYEERDNIADRFPFSYAESTDHLTDETDAICKRPDTDPFIFHTQTATEYWQRHGSLVHTDTQGNDLPLPENVRAYLWASSQHFANPRLTSPARGICQNVVNVVRTSMFFRALLDAMDRWATHGTPPPDSRIPTRADGTLVDFKKWRETFPAIQGVATPREPSSLYRFNFGPEAANGILSEQPPRIANTPGYTILVPAVDADGNDVAGIRAPMVQAPLATYTGWNIRTRGHGEGATHEFTGSTIPLPETTSMREATGDPRPAILERYPDAAAYQRAITVAAERLATEGFMLEEDVDRATVDAKDWDRRRHGITL